jgi:hypothetical protein
MNSLSSGPFERQFQFLRWRKGPRLGGEIARFLSTSPQCLTYGRIEDLKNDNP